MWIGPRGVGTLRLPKFGGSQKIPFFRVKLAHGEVTNLAAPSFSIHRPNISRQLDPTYVADYVKVPTLGGRGQPTTPIGRKIPSSVSLSEK